MRRALIPLVPLVAAALGLAAVGPAGSTAGPSSPSDSAQARPTHVRIVDPVRDVYLLLENPDGSDAGFVRRPHMRNGDITSAVVRHWSAAVNVTVHLAKLRRSGSLVFTIASLRTAHETWNTTVYAYGSDGTLGRLLQPGRRGQDGHPSRRCPDQLLQRSGPDPSSATMHGQPAVGPTVGRDGRRSRGRRSWVIAGRRGTGQEAPRTATVRRQGGGTPAAEPPARRPGPLSRSRSAARSCVATRKLGQRGLRERRGRVRDHVAEVVPGREAARSRCRRRRRRRR